MALTSSQCVCCREALLQNRSRLVGDLDTLKPSTRTRPRWYPGSPPRHYLEVAALTQGVVADVQVAVAGRLAAVLLLTLSGGHAQQTGLGKRLQVVGRHAPELKVRLVPEEPVDGGQPQAGLKHRTHTPPDRHAAFFEAVRRAWRFKKEHAGDVALMTADPSRLSLPTSLTSTHPASPLISGSPGWSQRH